LLKNFIGAGGCDHCTMPLWGRGFFADNFAARRIAAFFVLRVELLLSCFVFLSVLL
jgi:hypothetical protein